MGSTEIFNLLAIYGYPIIFLLVIIEGPLVTITSGFFASSGYLNVLLLYPLIVFADLSADVMWYLVGYFGKEKVVNRWGHFIGLNKERLKKIENLKYKFKNHQGKILFSAKITHAIGFPMLIASGVVKINFRKFIWYNFLATLPKSLILLALGYYFGEARQTISRYLGYSTIIGIIIFILAITIYLLSQKYIKKFFKNFEG
ncbi:MAG: VTT domain-containing protein [Candidatus Humimicrobiaceae bacterium]